MVLACADANFSADHLKWSGWGETFAAAQGAAAVNECEPTCADGNFRFYPVVLIAAGLRGCSNGQRQYTRIKYAFLGGRAPFPPDSPGATDPTVRFPCAR